MVEINKELNDSPGLINSSPYDKGWIVKVEVSNSLELNNLMDADKHAKFCEEEDASHRASGHEELWALFM
nr:glycine cleavage system h protein 2, mitochondrial [Quercus suber]